MHLLTATALFFQCKSLLRVMFLLLIKYVFLDFSRHWIFIQKFCDAFEPLFILTLKSQRDHVPLPQFYADWLMSQAQLSVVCSGSNTLAKKLLAAMEKRMKILRNCMPFKACLYIDPRFNFVGSNRLSTEEKLDIQVRLLKPLYVLFMLYIHNCILFFSNIS